MSLAGGVGESFPENPSPAEARTPNGNILSLRPYRAPKICFLSPTRSINQPILHAKIMIDFRWPLRALDLIVPHTPEPHASVCWSLQELHRAAVCHEQDEGSCGPLLAPPRACTGPLTASHQVCPANPEVQEWHPPPSEATGPRLRQVALPRVRPQVTQIVACLGHPHPQAGLWSSCDSLPLGGL